MYAWHPASSCMAIRAWLPGLAAAVYRTLMESLRQKAQILSIRQQPDAKLASSTPCNDKKQHATRLLLKQLVVVSEPSVGASQNTKKKSVIHSRFVRVILAQGPC